MSVFTNLLNLFKWDTSTDGDQEFDIDKALNENWDKIDIKFQQHVNSITNKHSNATITSDGFMSKENIINLANKVDKVEGKGLSTEDYTNLEKSKLAGIEEGAEVNTIISDLEEITTINNNDYLQVSHNGKNKKIKAEKLGMGDSLKSYIIQRLVSISASGNSTHGLYYNIRNLFDDKLLKKEIGYTDIPSMLAEVTYTEVNDLEGEITIPGTSDVTVYVWIRLTYSDIGEILLYEDITGGRYTAYITTEEIGGGGEACFTGDTLITTSNGLKRIEDIKIGDIIVTEKRLQKVTKKYEHITEKIYNIKTQGLTIQASYSHPFVTERGIVMAKDLISGDILFDINNNRLYINEIIIEKSDTVVYEINTNADNYYITDKQILVASEVL